MMKRRDLEKKVRRIAKDHGVEVSEGEGGEHSKWTIGRNHISIPRHSEIAEFTARGIIRDAEAFAQEEQQRNQKEES